MVLNEFKEQTIFRITESANRIEKCVNIISHSELWKSPNSTLNSIGNLVLHLNGNITQYIISALGGENDQRKRDEEFFPAHNFNKQELINRFKTTIKNAVEIIRQIEQSELNKIKYVQGFKLTGVGIIIHVVEHLSYHTGQISLLTKLFTNQNLGFYKNQDLNLLNKN